MEPPYFVEKEVQTPAAPSWINMLMLSRRCHQKL